MDWELKELKIGDKVGNNIDHTINNNLLLEVVLNNRIDEIDDIVKKSSRSILCHKYEEYDNKPILIIACINEAVTKDTLNSLCKSITSHHYRIDCYDEEWYKWDPLHYVARLADSEKLQVLVDNLVEVNGLTTFSENALHVLLDYQQGVKPFNTMLYNGTESKDCVIINSEKENTVNCAKILIKAGIDVNHSNLWNETPICLAVRYRYIKITEMLLKVPAVDIDDYKEGGITVRAYLKENYICQNTIAQSHVLYEDPVKILFDYLKAGDEDAFIQFNNENIKDYANCIDGDIEYNTSGNMLQICFKKGYLEYLQHESYTEEPTKSSLTENLMLKVFISNGFGKCVDHLLSNGADPTLTYRKFSQPLLEAASTVGYYPLVSILLEHKNSKVTSEDIFRILPKLYEEKYTNKLKNHNSYRKHVLSLLLNKLLAFKDTEKLSSENLTTLNDILYKLNLRGDDEKEDDTENICRILKLGASLTRRMDDNKMVIESIHVDILRLHFDDCIENNMFCYNSIIEDDATYSETRALQYLANDKKKCELLRHPLLIHLIHNKWLRNFYFFYMDLILYLLFLLSIYAYMILSQKQHSSKLINISFYSLLTVHFVKECIQLLFLYRLKYFFDTSNYLELTVIICCFTSIFNYNEYGAVIAILFSTVIFVTLLGQIPAFAKYTIIFGSTRYFLQYASFYFVQFVSFALVFYIIFPFEVTKDKAEDLDSIIGDVFKSLFNTLVLFTGEFGDRVLDSKNFPIFGRLIMTVFIFCMTIILNNLLVGLIVADMDEMQRTGKLYKQIKIANFIARMNSIIKRLHEFSSINIIKRIINMLHIFEKGKNKVIDLNQCKHAEVFDDDNRKYMKSIRNGRNSYKRDPLKNVHMFVLEKVAENQKKMKNVKK